MKNVIKTLTLAAVLGLTSTAAMAGPNLVTNGDFEQGDAGWIDTMFIQTSLAHSGSHAAETGCVNTSCVNTQGVGAYLAQTINTTAGSNYTMSFWVIENGGPTSEMTIFWNGAKVADVVNPANNTVITNNWVEFTFDNLIASSNSTTFEIHGRQDPAYIFFDDVSVVESDASALPEPASLALLGLGLGGVAVARRRRQ